MRTFTATALQYLVRIVGIDIVLAALVCAALAVLGRSLSSFGTWFFWAGLITMAIGLLAVVGSTGITRSGSYAIGRTVGEQDVAARINADLKDETASFSFLFLALGAGILAMLLSRLF